MGFSTVLTAAVQGLVVKFVHVEADSSNGLPMLHMVGYLASEVKEAGERVRTAIRNTGFQLAPKKVVINFAPVHVRKRGASFDVPMAVALLAAFQLIDPNGIKDTLFIGELSLDGQIRKVSGILPIVAAAEKQGCHRCIVPKENVVEGSLVGGIQVIGVNSLREVCDYLNGRIAIEPCHYVERKSFGESDMPKLDYADLKGQHLVRRATEVAVAGGHNILYIGPPGSGKTMTAMRIPTILPPLTHKESIEITKVYSVLGLVDEKRPLVQKRPFRSIHHTITTAALVGGGFYPVPGEVSLASGGVLFLDELAEFQKSVLEVLRQPLEEKEIRIIRKHGTSLFPADMMLVAAMNPCPCGNYPDYNKCICTEGQIRQYLGKISQPLLDRIDVCIEAPKINYEILQSNKKEESSETIRARICLAREIQSERYKSTGIMSNARMDKEALETYCALDEQGSILMQKSFDKLSLTARGYYKILKVARTIADLEFSEEIKAVHLREAISYRMIDKKYWGKLHEI